MTSITSGPQPADVLIVGEAPGSDEIRKGEPFVGKSGQELTRMLHEAGLIRTACRIVNVTSYRPPGNDISHFFPSAKAAAGIPNAKLINGRYCTPEIAAGLMKLKAEIARTKPKVIIPLGDTALWALTGLSGIGSWRGSVLRHSESGATIVPTYHPAGVLRMWSWRFIAVNDLRRAAHYTTAAYPERELKLNAEPTYVEVISTLKRLMLELDTSWGTEKILAVGEGTRLRVAVDIETRANHIDCIGIAWSATDAMCIPLCRMADTSSYWTLDEEADILRHLRHFLLHPQVDVVGQNFLYDAMYFARYYGWYPTPYLDTMIAHAVAFPGIPKSLDFLSSLYLDDHLYWKAERKEADTKVSDLQRWEYNCKDCIATWRVVDPILESIAKGDLTEPLKHEMALFDPLMQTMMRGTRIDQKLRSTLALELMDVRAEYERWFLQFSPVWEDVELVKSKTAQPWYNSPKQQQKIFYEILHQKVQRNRKTGKPSVDDEALARVMKAEPLLAKLCTKLLEYRSIGVFLSTFVEARYDKDNRARTAYNPVGTETFRFNSKIDAFGRGLNLQNIPKGDEG